MPRSGNGWPTTRKSTPNPKSSIVNPTNSARGPS